jgi:hypothetical protein
MTNTESPSGVGFDRVASWDGPDECELDDQLITEDDIRELEAYGFDSDQQTLVGLGPSERARRSRTRVEIQDSQRMPPSQAPGPFVADGDELPPSLRPRKLPAWAVAMSILLLLLVAGALALPSSTPRTAAASGANGSRATNVLAAKVETVETVSPPAANVDAVAPADADAMPPNEPQRPAAPPEVTPHPAASLVTAPVVAAAPPVTLPELPPPSVVDLAGGADPSVGTINVTSSPPANVVLDGRPLGKAPRVVRVPAGVHTLVFVHPLYGRQSLSVSVIPGVTARASANF